MTTNSIVVFDYTWWSSVYPNFASLGEPEVQNYFDLATSLCDNSPCSIVPYCPPKNNQRRNLLGLLTAHIAALFGGINGDEPSGLVGRVSNAAQGTESAATDFGDMQPGQEWYAQTRWGALYWASTNQYRLSRYHVRPGMAPGNYPTEFPGAAYPFGGLPWPR